MRAGSGGGAGLGAAGFAGAFAAGLAGAPAGEPLPAARDLLRGRLGAAERFTQPARNGGLHSGGRGFDEFTLIAQTGENFLTGDTELFSQLVYTGLTCHYNSCLGGGSGGWRRASG